MITVPNPVIDEFQAMFRECLATGKRTLISSAELRRLIEESPKKFRHTIQWLDGKSEKAKSQFLSLGMVQAGASPYSNSPGNKNRAWSITEAA